tara:strand:+ start:429 stop:1481 length:1053 start_codon:yes stop_codon:yes gene_type:complete
MKFIFYLLFSFVFFISGAQDSLTFNNVIILDVNDVESQGKTGTCWSYATSSFLESELIRMGEGQYDLSEMFVARQVYIQKADNFIRRHGKANFSEGSLSHDLINTINNHGIVPNSVFNGLTTNSNKHDHSELSAVLEGYLNAIIKQEKPSVLWKKGYNAILDVYLGEYPELFEIDGKQFSPISFAKKINLNGDNYINLTSFTHHPFYNKFILEVPDNWSNGSFLNIPIDEMLEITNKALNNGFSIAWDTDVSNKGFDAKKGLADITYEVTQEMRQDNFDNYTVTDDHLMHITGLVKGSDGKSYFLVKNSWGNKIGLENYKGYILVSENYFKLHTISIMLHKDGVSKKYRK